MEERHDPASPATHRWLSSAREKADFRRKSAAASGRGRINLHKTEKRGPAGQLCLFCREPVWLTNFSNPCRVFGPWLPPALRRAESCAVRQSKQPQLPSVLAQVGDVVRKRPRGPTQ